MYPFRCVCPRVKCEWASTRRIAEFAECAERRDISVSPVPSANECVRCAVRLVAVSERQCVGAWRLVATARGLLETMCIVVRLVCRWAKPAEVSGSTAEVFPLRRARLVKSQWMSAHTTPPGSRYHRLRAR